jgi:hypothetical protein
MKIIISKTKKELGQVAAKQSTVIAIMVSMRYGLKI